MIEAGINTIAIDGPAASGKTTVGKMLAECFGFLFFDTGLLYRALTWAAIQNKVSYQSEDMLIALLEKTNIEINPPTVDDGRNADVIINHEDVTLNLNRDEVNQLVSDVAKHAKVRMALTTKMRQIGLRGNVVMVGRDVGTVILPEAKLKIYLEASLEERARRRYEEQKQKNNDYSTYQEILANLQKRDSIDSNRTVAPLKAAEDAIIIHTDGLSQQEVVQKIKKIIEENHHFSIDKRD